MMTTTGEDRFFESDGVTIRYIVLGSGEPVVLLHGGTERIESWADQRFFDCPFDGFHLIAMDYRGHGKSGKPHTPAAYGRKMVGDVLRLLDHLGIARAHIVGHSTGAEIALKMASLYPERLNCAVLAGSGWSDEGLHGMIRQLAESFEREGLRPFFEWSTPPGRSWTADEIEGFEDANRAMLAENDTRALAAFFRSYGEFRVSEDELRAIQVPMLGVAGEFDKERPMLERMRGVAPDFTMVVLEGLGHGGTEFGCAVAEEAYRFFRRVRLREEDERSPKEATK